MYRLRALLFASLLSTSAVAGNVYTWTDENGTVHYSSQPLNSGESKQVKIPTINTLKSEPQPIVSNTKKENRLQTSRKKVDTASMISSDLCAGAKRKLKFSSEMLASGNFVWKGNTFKKENLIKAKRSAKKQIKDYC
ncbi:DUF4124 domain-containing protein [Motilimonas pumila]|uniref:DUF4124 domain-containing protein n=1 Tax=Motilimonas pumila TaxID=2303987 RepID=A0A418YG58_9GAMM|nr:DUF4124 domain-containing protein [Motilimonas pumila]RJG48635.1 DUF4124 domain-containing protein [Motilimonas pumila]